jgi:hypothetical protein
MHMDRPVFVFASNLAGRHSDGTALEAVLTRGAIHGQGFGLQGNSYAIPAKDENLRALPLVEIAAGVERFLDFARTRPWLLFEVKPVLGDLAGYKPDDVASMFEHAPHNVTLP